MRIDFQFYFKAFIILVFLYGCEQPFEKTTTKLFDFGSFFNKEIALLNEHETALKKTIIQGENVFSSMEKKPDWEKELAVFKSFSFIKPQNEELYEADTLQSDRGFMYFTYTAISDKMRLQMAEVMVNPEQKIEKITLVIRTNEKISNSDMTLTYLPQKGYDVKGEINSKIAGESIIDVHVECTN